MKKGEAKIEFFTNLKYLQNEYNNGLVVSKFLYEKAVRGKKITMSYWQFNKYFNDLLAMKKSPIEKPDIKSRAEENTPIQQSKSQEPLRARISTKEKKVFDPMFGKQIKDDDLL